jgi:type 1 glutamine amidotransferase
VTDKEILVITKGHPFERDPFARIFDEMKGVNWTHVEQPAAQVFFDPDLAEAYDAFVLYDMPGIRFRPGELPEQLQPSERLVANMRALMEKGFGIVALHHAIAGWPAWPQYAEILGGRFLYATDELRGETRPDSGYRHGITQNIEIIEDHPVTRGVVPFEITDEAYLFEVFEDAVEPLLASDYGFVRDNFYSATLAVRDGKLFTNEGWTHAPGSRYVGWVKNYLASPIAYLQFGDDPVAYENAGFRQLLKNAIDWVASPEAHEWARERGG